MDGDKTGLENPAVIRFILRIFYVLCASLFVADFFIDRKVYHSLESFPAFYPAYGFVGCVLLVLIARGMRSLLMRAEDYYDDELKQPKRKQTHD